MKTTFDRWSSRVARSDGCWTWLGCKTKAGYGQIHDRGRRTTAHRVAYELASGMIIPKHLDACHRCDNPSCVRPDHIFVGTRSENLRDSVRKGRWIYPGRRQFFNERNPVKLNPEMVQGIRNAAAKLTEDQVRWIRTQQGVLTSREIGRRLGVEKTAVLRIWNGRGWKHLKD